MLNTGDLLRVIRDVRRAGDDATLATIAARAGWSPFYFHRVFRTLLRETPKQYWLRLRLERAAATLVSTGRSVLDVALDAGFTSHEVFTRAFRRYFGRSPADYRANALRDATGDARARHAMLVESSGPCVHMFHLSIGATSRRPLMATLSIERREIAAQPIVFVTLRAGRHELPTAIAEGLGKAFPYTQRAGLTIAGRPFTRYLSTGPGLFDIEVGIPVASSASREGDVEAGSLPGGAVAVALHGGAYDQLQESYVALERWIESQGYRIGGPPWESYVTDPADLPNSDDWRTEIYWPLAN